MSERHSFAQPPAILIAWSPQHQAWRATAIVAGEGDPARVEGPSTSTGRHPADALQALLDARFGILADQQCAPTVVEVAVLAEPDPSSRPELAL